MSYEAWWGKPRFYCNEATILAESISAIEAWKVRIAMFLRHDPSSLCNTTGALLVVGILDRDGCAKGDLLSKVALHSGASRQPA